MQATSDEVLIGRIASGDRLAMQVLFARHHVRVYRFVLRLVRDESVAEDLISEVFLDVWRQAGRFEGRSQVSTWLLAISRFKALSALRRRPDEELDEETGLSYFGARYYDPRPSVWQSADPILEKYLPITGKKVDLTTPALGNQWHDGYDLPGLGGVFNSRTLAIYGYASENPLKYTDPDGRILEFPDNGPKTAKIKQIIANLEKGSPRRPP